MIRRASLLLTSLAIALTCALPAGAQSPDRPLPDKATFLREARARLQPDEVRQAGYVYLEKQRRLKLDGRGRTTGESVRVVESYPGLPGEEQRWERVLVDDGKTLNAAQLAKQDAERQKKAEAFMRKQAGKSPAEIAREKAKRDRQEAARVEDVFAIFDMQLLRREPIKGHDTIVMSLSPRPAVTPKSDIGKWLKYFKGQVWISESEYELVKMEVEAVKDVSVGFGLLARLHKGARATFERTKVNDEIWLPARAEYTISGRVMLLKRLREGGIAEFSDYRKFGVTTDTAYGTPTTQR